MNGQRTVTILHFFEWLGQFVASGRNLINEKTLSLALNSILANFLPNLMTKMFEPIHSEKQIEVNETSSARAHRWHQKPKTGRAIPTNWFLLAPPLLLASPDKALDTFSAKLIFVRNQASLSHFPTCSMGFITFIWARRTFSYPLCGRFFSLQQLLEEDHRCKRAWLIDECDGEDHQARKLALSFPPFSRRFRELQYVSTDWLMIFKLIVIRSCKNWILSGKRCYHLGVKVRKALDYFSSPK